MTPRVLGALVVAKHLTEEQRRLANARAVANKHAVTRLEQEVADAQRRLRLACANFTVEERSDFGQALNFHSTAMSIEAAGTNTTIGTAVVPT